MPGRTGVHPRPLVCLALCVGLSAALTGQQSDPARDRPVFSTSDQCIACHTNLRDETGSDVSIGHAWRATMMAQAAKDPYWHAAVRREVMDQPRLQSAIEDTCATCHMPMARTTARADGNLGQVFAHLEGLAGDVDEGAELATDGVSCTVCHQIQPDGFGEHASFDGGYRIGGPDDGNVAIFGPFDDVDDGLRRIMESATGFSPTEGTHVQESELCATCHTLFTTGLDDAGQKWADCRSRFPIWSGGTVATATNGVARTATCPRRRRHGLHRSSGSRARVFPGMSSEAATPSCCVCSLPIATSYT